MPNLPGKIYLTIIFVALAVTLIGCSSGAVVEDIGPVASVEALATPIADVVEELPAQRPGAQDQANVPTESVEPVSPVSPATPIQTQPKTEIIEPVSPITSAAPAEKVRRSMDQQKLQPIKGSEKLLAAAKDDLAQRTGVPANDITLVSMEAIEWSDTSLGCPEEGYMYAQVITPGYLVILEAGGQQYEYHTDQIENFVLCEQ